MNTKILFRADGHNKMGLGHIVRSLALLKMLENNFDCFFAVQDPPKNLLPQIKGYCDQIIELPKTNHLEKEAQKLCEGYLTGNEIVVLDGYHFGTKYQEIIKRRGCKIVCIDDIHDVHFLADVIINHAGGIQKEQYSAEDYTQFYLGFDYTLLREPFLEAAKNRLSPNDYSIPFICLGGADPENATLIILKQLEEMDTIEQCYVVIGGAYLHKKELEEFMICSRLKIVILENICASRMIEIMRTCSIAITSPSTIALEYLSIGGDLYLYPIAANQKFLFDFLTQKGIAFDFNQFPIINKEKRSMARDIQKKEFDGKSKERLLKIFEGLEQEIFCEIRRANKEDMKIFFEWANEEKTRRQSFSSLPIRMEEHIDWFFKKLFSTESYLYVLEFKGVPVGQIRFDLDKKTVLSFSVGSSFRGKGLGIILLKKGIEQIQKDRKDANPIIGYVKKDNIASNKVFSRLGFQKEKALEKEMAYTYSI